MDGKFVQWKNAKIHVISHALHYGSAVFEGIRVYNTKKGPAIFRLKEHVKRFVHSMKAIGMDLPFTEKELFEACVETVKKNKIKDGYLRPLAYYGYGKMGLNPTGAPVNVLIAVWPWTNYLSEDPAIKIKISKYIRLHNKSIERTAKVSGYYANSLLASLEVRAQGFHEALFVDYNGNVAEGPGQNIFMVKKGKIYTPTKEHILAGLTRDSVMQFAKDKGVKITEKNLKPKDFYSADEVFLVGTATEVAPVKQMDKHKIAKGKIGPVTEEFHKLYLDVVTGKEPKYEKWLTYIK